MFKSEIYCMVYSIARVVDDNWPANDFNIKTRAQVLYKRWKAEYDFDLQKLRQPLRPVTYAQLVLTQEEEELIEDEEDDGNESDGYGILSDYWKVELSDQ